MKSRSSPHVILTANEKMFLAWFANATRGNARWSWRLPRPPRGNSCAPSHRWWWRIPSPPSTVGCIAQGWGF